ncbi:MAG: hypothetical protein ACLPN1_03140 [Dissulfurispiraceae bacterium]|jgi:Tfp pilus assembly protein PilV
MFHGILNKKGFTMIDALMALCITLVGVAGLLATMPIGWGLAGTADMRTRALEIMHSQLENDEMLIMDPCNTFAANGALPQVTVTSSGAAAALPGDLTFTVNKWIQQAGSGWQITVQVTWPGTSTGVSETRMVNRQYDYQDNANCATTRVVTL